MRAARNVSGMIIGVLLVHGLHVTSGVIVIMIIIVVVILLDRLPSSLGCCCAAASFLHGCIDNRLVHVLR